MIPEIDEALGGLLRSRVVPGGQVEVSFEPPTREWAAGRNTPTVNVYLYEIREDTGRREYGIRPVRDSSGIVTERKRPLRFFRLSYLMTCWTRRPEDEHRLLSSVLGCVIGAEALPVEGTGALAALGIPVQLTLAEPSGDSRPATDLWSALGGNLRPSIDLTVIAPYPDELGQPVPPPATEVRVVGRRTDVPDAVDRPRVRRGR